MGFGQSQRKAQSQAQGIHMSLVLGTGFKGVHGMPDRADVFWLCEMLVAVLVNAAACVLCMVRLKKWL